MKEDRIDELWNSSYSDRITHRKFYRHCTTLGGKDFGFLVKQLFTSRWFRNKLKIDSEIFNSIKPPKMNDIVPPEKVFIVLGVLLELREKVRNKEVDRSPFKSIPLVVSTLKKYEIINEVKLDDERLQRNTA